MSILVKATGKMYKTSNQKFQLTFTLMFICFIIGIVGCKDQEAENIQEAIPPDPIPDEIVVITVNTPIASPIFLSKKPDGSVDSLGARMVPNPTKITYLDNNNLLQTWYPKTLNLDTLSISIKRDQLELTTNDPLSTVPTTFLLNRGDTVKINYDDYSATAQVLNRDVGGLDLNFDQFRHDQFFVDGIDPNHIHYNLFSQKSDTLSWEESIKLSRKRGLNNLLKERAALDSLYEAGAITNATLNYRDAIYAYRIKMAQKGMTDLIMTDNEQEQALPMHYRVNSINELQDEVIDSLMTYHFFRSRASTELKFNLPWITVDRGSSGGRYIDHRVQFDSILKSDYPSSVKEMGLYLAYKGIAENFKVADKEKYFKLLAENTRDVARLQRLKQSFNLNFSTQNELLLETTDGTNISYHELLNQHKGKWLYIDFWASWCQPCIATFPDAASLKKKLSDKNVVFLNLALNDRKDAWKNAINKYKLTGSEQFFITNSTTSTVIEELQVETIPHYLIYNPEGKLVNAYAPRPGEGAADALTELMVETGQ